MLQKTLAMPFSLLPLLFLLLLCFSVSLHVEATLSEDVPAGARPYLVKRGHRRSLVVTDYGEISSVEITSGTNGTYHLQFITLEPNSFLLPVLLHADMVFYVHSGNGKLSWTDDGREMRRLNLRRGDVFRLQAGSVLFMQSSLEEERQKLRIYAIFSNTEYNIYEPSIGAYSSISDLVLGFDKKILQSAFKVSEDVIEDITSSTKPPAVVHAEPTKKSLFRELEDRLPKILVGGRGIPFYGINGKHKKTKTFNILDADPDFENCNGWSLTVDKWSLKSLRDSNAGIFMVNLTKGSMMAPHWNPMATEIAVVLHGQGIVRMVCSSTANESECKNLRFKVKEGDVFAVPRFHPMAQMSFNNDSFVFMGFSTSTRRNYPQFLAGKRSVLRTLDRDILAMSFNVANTTIDQLLAAQEDELILDCTSCAEEEETIMKEEIRKETEEEEARKREEEKERKREEKEEEERKREEEEARKREEEAARKREEEEAKKREEEREREEEEARKKEEEEERERKEEEARKREEEAARKREEEMEREREEEESRKREEERRKEEEAERERERQEDEEEARRREEKRRQEEQKRREETAQREQEEARRQEEERQRKRREEEERAKKERERQEEERQKEEEEAKERERQEKEARKEKERQGGGGEQPEEGEEWKAIKEDQEHKGNEGKGRASRKAWKF